MNSAIDSLLSLLAFTELPYSVLVIISILITGVFIFLLMALFATLAVYFERKVSAFMQDRLGPMEVGLIGFKGGRKFWGGIGQTIADALKLLTKEDILPNDSDKKLMVIAPFIIFMGALLTFIGIPFSEGVIISDFNIGVFYVVAMSSVGVIGIILAGWSSNNKWSLYGAMRSAAQIISYEIPLGLSVLLPVLVVGSLEISEIVAWQSEHRWFILHSPFTFVAFFIFFISALAETNRPPFDLPEAEAELVAGYQTEYSGMMYAMFWLGEYANILLMCAMGSILFLGGWLPPVDFFPFNEIPSPLWLIFKILFLFILFSLVKAIVPRYRYDQLMKLGWKIFLPLSLIYVVLTASFLLYFNKLPLN